MHGETKTAEQSILTLDYRSLALFRVSMGLVILFDLVCRSFQIETFYADTGLVPRAALIQHAWYDRYASIYMLTGDPVGVGALFVLAGLFALALVVGYRTRLATLVSWLFLLSLHNRNDVVLQGGDHLLRLLCFWSLFLPLGAKYSVDSRSRPPPAGDSFTSIATLGVLLQIVFLYEFSALQKLMDPLWRNGTVIKQALLLDDFAKPLGVRLLGFDTPLRIVTWLTLFIETVLPLLIFLPKRTGLIRTIVVFVFWLMHLGIHVVLYVGFFTPVTLMSWTIVLPGYFWNGVRSWLFPVVANASSREDSRDRGPGRSGMRERAGACALVALLAVVTVDNLSHTPGYNFRLPHPLPILMKRSGLSQNWSMFTSLQSYARGWYLIPGHLTGGTEVDLFRAGQPLSWGRPDRPYAWISDNRWYKYYVRIDSDRYAFLRPYLGPYLCEQWNRTHDADHQIEALCVARIAQAPLPSERIDPKMSRVLVSQECRPESSTTHQHWLEETRRRIHGLAPASTPR
jgi:hypothetical protein